MTNNMALIAMRVANRFVNECVENPMLCIPVSHTSSHLRDILITHVLHFCVLFRSFQCFYPATRQIMVKKVETIIY